MSSDGSPIPSRDEHLARAIADYLEAADGGKSPDRKVFLALHADLREELEEFFAGEDGARKLGAAVREAREVRSPLRGLERIGGLEILDEIARGGMGVVYRAREPALGRVVALKVILTGALASTEERERFLREARAAARLEHPGIVPIYDVGEEGGFQYFTMRLLEGGSLALWSPPEGRDPRRAAALVAQVARAVHHAHEHGIIHRDLKPANILLDSEGRPYVSDFGLARSLDVDSSLTATGQVLGTASYVAPEQARSGGVPDRAADVYSLGAILYELLTGGPPFRGAGVVETLRQAEIEEPRRPSMLNRLIPADLEKVCLKCLEKTPGRRYAGALELANDLERFLNGEAVTARSASSLERGRRWCRRHPALAVTAVLLVAVTAGALATAGFVLRLRGETLQNLASARLAEARTGALGGRIGGRLQGLIAIREAAQVRRDLEVRNAAILCMSRPDFELLARIRPIFHANCMALDGELDHFAQGDESGTVVVRESAGGREIAKFVGEGRMTLGLAFSPDGRLLARSTGSPAQPGDLAVWDWRRSTIPIARIPERVTSSRIGFDAGSRLIAFGTVDGFVKVFDVAGGKETVSHQIDGIVKHLVFEPKGKRLCIATRDSRIIVLDLARGSKDFERPGQAFCMDPTGRSVVIANGSDVGLFDLERGQQLASLRGHDEPVIETAWHTGDQTILTSGWDNTIRLWTLQGRELLRHHGSISFPAFSRDGSRFGYQGADGSLFLWRFVRSDEVHRTSSNPTQFFDPVFDPLDRFVAVPNPEGILLLHPRGGQVMAELRQGRVNSCLISPDGSSAITAGPRGLFRWPLRQEEGGGELKITSGPPKAITSDRWPYLTAALSVDGRYLLACVETSKLKLVDLEDSSRPPWQFEHKNVTTLAVAKGGRWAASGPLHGRDARVWDAHSRALAKVYTLDRPVMSAFVAFSPSGEWFALSTGDGISVYRVGLWDDPVHEHMRDEPIEVWSPTAFSPDSRLLAITPSQRSIRLLETDTGIELATLETTNPKMIRNLAFGTRGHYLAVVLDSREILFWNLPRLRASLRDLGLDWSGPPEGAPNAPSGSVGDHQLTVEVILEERSEGSAR